MKLKATISRRVMESEGLIIALETIRSRVLNEVLKPCLKTGDFGPAEFFVQECDFANRATHEPFCEARLTGVSINDDRAPNDFRRAVKKLFSIYKDVIEKLTKKGIKTQLYVSLMLDAPLPNTDSSIVEVGPEWVEGML